MPTVKELKKYEVRATRARGDHISDTFFANDIHEAMRHSARLVKEVYGSCKKVTVQEVKE